MKTLKKLLRPALFIVGGMIAGLVYYRFFGCTTGCPITSSPWMTTAYFTLLGAVLSMMWTPAKPKAPKASDEDPREEAEETAGVDR